MRGSSTFTNSAPLDDQPGTKSVTLHDVAREAGVSLITASRALSNPGGLKSRRSLTVAALVPAISVAQFLPTVQALTESLDAAGYQLILGQGGYAHSREEALLNTLISRRPDGIVVTGLVHSDAARERLRQSGIPVVETWDLSDRPLDMMVGFSHLKVGSEVAGYFLGKGWRWLSAWWTWDFASSSGARHTSAQAEDSADPLSDSL